MSLSEHTLRSLLGYQLQRATSAAIARHINVFKSYGLRRTTFSCLSLIIENPGLQQRQLGETLAIERPNLVRIVESLTEQGLITRETSPSDRRAYCLTATEAGHDLFREALAAVNALEADLDAGLTTDEKALLKKALARIEQNAARLEPR